MYENSLGIAHFLAQSDVVARGVLVSMVLGSILTWGIIGDRLFAHWRASRRRAAFLEWFRRVRALEALSEARPPHLEEACARLLRLAIESARHLAAHGEGCECEQFMTRVLRQGIDEEAERLERGLVLLASIGSTAPSFSVPSPIMPLRPGWPRPQPAASTSAPR